MLMLDEWAARHRISAAALAELRALLNPSRPASAPTAYTSEDAVQSGLQLTASAAGCELWRNNSGALKDERGRLIRFGLGNTSASVSEHWKSSDLIGIFPRVITGDMVGRTIGQFAAVEVKAPGWKKPTNDRERAQERFLMSIRAMGGFASFAQSVGDVFHAPRT